MEQTWKYSNTHRCTYRMPNNIEKNVKSCKRADKELSIECLNIKILFIIYNLPGVRVKRKVLDLMSQAL